MGISLALIVGYFIVSRRRRSPAKSDVKPPSGRLMVLGSSIGLVGIPLAFLFGYFAVSTAIPLAPSSIITRQAVSLFTNIMSLKIFLITGAAVLWYDMTEQRGTTGKVRAAVALYDITGQRGATGKVQVAIERRLGRRCNWWPLEQPTRSHDRGHDRGQVRVTWRCVSGTHSNFTSTLTHISGLWR